MNSTASTTSSNMPSYSALAEENALLREQLQVMQRQLDWFKKQLFGPKSEKQVFDLPEQDSLFASGDAPVPAQPPKNEKRMVKAYQRGTAKKQRDDDCLNDTGLHFTADVPVEVVEHLPPELTGPEADQYEVIGSKTTFRLAQRASSYVVLKCERPVFRRKGSDKPITHQPRSTYWTTAWPMSACWPGCWSTSSSSTCRCIVSTNASGKPASPSVAAP